MHDWILREIRFDWKAGRATLELEDSTFATRTVVAEGVSDLRVPRAYAWGPSVNVNEVSPIEVLPSGLRQLKIEMQSGDEIQIIAERFTLPG